MGPWRLACAASAHLSSACRLIILPPSHTRTDWEFALEAGHHYRHATCTKRNEIGAASTARTKYRELLPSVRASLFAEAFDFRGRSAKICFLARARICSLSHARPSPFCFFACPPPPPAVTRARNSAASDRTSTPAPDTASPSHRRAPCRRLARTAHGQP